MSSTERTVGAAGGLTELSCCLEASRRLAGGMTPVPCERGGFVLSSWLCKVAALQGSDLEQVTCCRYFTVS